MASNLILFTYLESLTRRILPEKRIDQNKIIRPSEMIWFPSVLSRVERGGDALWLGQSGYQPVSCEGRPLPACRTRGRHPGFTDEGPAGRTALLWPPRGRSALPRSSGRSGAAEGSGESPANEDPVSPSPDRTHRTH